MDDPLFESVEGSGPYTEAQVTMSCVPLTIHFGQAAYHAGDYNNIIPLCEKEIKEGGPNKVRFVSFLSVTQKIYTYMKVPFYTGQDFSRQPSWC